MKYYKNKKMKKIKDIIQSQNKKEMETNNTDIEDSKPTSLYNTIYDVSITILKYLYQTIKILISISGIYLVWICLHYFASHLYVKLCVPFSLYGFLLSPFLIATPYCVGLRWVIYNGANTIQNMWILLGTWACSTITIFNSK